MAKKKNPSQKKYSKASQKEVEKEMHHYKEGKAHSGKALAPVESREQAIAIGLSKARKKGEKVPKKPTKARSTRARKTTATKSKSRTKKAASSRSKR